ncbi:MAG: DNA polymerase III subunit gamma/tau [Actinobacteria bacterium]|nr:DNA polymerase III subunit gamma/tau [Actinomycetota bacterium]
MAYVSLYRKYRSQDFEEILGQEHVSRTLANAIDDGRVHHAYLFTGPRGTGKTSTARILAKALNCEKGPTSKPCGKCNSCVAIAEGSSLDVIELDAASHSSVDSTREILAGVPLATAGSNKKVYVIDEVHMLTPQSFNALLKTLEEPPPHVVFVLATTEAHKVLPTIVSRTQRFDFRRIPADVLQDHLAKIAKQENIDVAHEALGIVARHSDGSARDALSVLDQLSSMGGHIAEEDVERLLGGRTEDAFAELFDAISSHDLNGVFRVIESLVARGADMRQTALGVLEHARSLLLVKTAPEAESLIDASPEDRLELVAAAGNVGGTALVRTMDLVAHALTEMRNAPAHRLLLEIALIRATSPETDASASGLLGRIERLERRIGIAGAVEDTPAPSVPAQAEAPAPARPSKAVPKPARGKPAAKPEVAERPAAAEPSPPRAPAESSHVGLGHIKDAWPATLKEVSKASRRVGAYLTPSRPVGFEGDVLAVEVQSAFHRDAMTQPANRDALANAVFASLGIKPEIAFEARGEGSGSSPSGTDPSPANLVEGAPDETQTVDHDPIELVKKGLGAEIVEEREDG